VEEGEYDGNMYSYVKMEKQDLLKLFQNGGKEKKENDGGVHSTMTYYKNFCKCHSVPPV
jgi:hypothetical protein